MKVKLTGNAGYSGATGIDISTVFNATVIDEGMGVEILWEDLLAAGWAGDPAFRGNSLYFSGLSGDYIVVEED